MLVHPIPLAAGDQVVNDAEDQQCPRQEDLGLQGVVTKCRDQDLPDQRDDDHPDEDQDVELPPLQGLDLVVHQLDHHPEDQERTERREYPLLEVPLEDVHQIPEKEGDHREGDADEGHDQDQVESVGEALGSLDQFRLQPVGDEHLAQFLLLVGTAHDVQVDVEHLLYRDPVFAPVVYGGEALLQELDQEPPHHVHGGVHVVRVQPAPDMGLADTLQGDQVVVVVRARKQGQKPVGVDGLQFLPHGIVVQELGRFRDLQQVVVELLYHPAAVVLGHREEVLEEPGVGVGEEVMFFYFLHGQHKPSLVGKRTLDATG